MKKNLIWSMLAIMMVTMLSVSFTSCGDSDNEVDDEKITAASIVGSWAYTTKHGSYEIRTFNADGTYTIVHKDSKGEQDYFESGTYVFNVKEMTLTINTLVGEKLGYHSPYTVILKGNQLTLIEKDGDVRGPMTKQ